VIWQRVLELQARGEPDWQALRAGLAKLGACLGYDHLVIEPHRVVGDKPWLWIHEKCQLERWQRSRQIRDALNAALLAQTQKVAAG
jgi:hypothetical protein